MASLTFPRDEGCHPEAASEWWYLNAHLKCETGTEFGLLLNFLRDHVLFMLADRMKGVMVYRTVLRGKELRSSTSGLDLAFGESWWRRVGEGSYALHFEHDGFRADLRMRATKPPLVVNGSGLIQEGILGHSYYYAQPMLKIEGSIGTEGSSTNVDGIGWIDRQWGSWEWSGLGRWTWLSIQLDSGEELMGFNVLHPITHGIVLAALNVSEGDGTVRVIDRCHLRRIKAWRSPRTGRDYGTVLDISDGKVIRLRARASFDDQELQDGFWEGTCSIEGTMGSRRVTGVGYLEQADPLSHFSRVKRLFYLYVGATNFVSKKLSRGLGPDVWNYFPVK